MFANSATHTALSTEVADALRSNLPVVALECTLITHGLPWPSTAQAEHAMARVVREVGDVPAAIAVLGSAITVGVPQVEIERLARGFEGGVPMLQVAVASLVLVVGVALALLVRWLHGGKIPRS